MSIPGTALRRARLRLMPMAPPSETDDAIIEAVQRHDHRAAAEIYDRLFGAVDQTLYRVLGRRGTDHDDLVQQAFEQIIQTLSRHTFARMCSLNTWAKRVATNVGLNALRARRRERTVIDQNWTFDDDTSIESCADPHRTIDSRAELVRVRRFLAEMKPEQVEVLLLHDAFGHELAEIALMIGASVPAAQSRLFRGRRDLRERLERGEKKP